MRPSWNKAYAESYAKFSFPVWDVFIFILIIQLPFLQLLLPFDKSNFILVFGLITIAYFKKVDLSIPIRMIVLFLVYIILCVVQGLYFGRFSSITLIYSFAYVFIAPYLLLRIYGLKAIFLFERAIFILTILSLILWIGHQISPSLKGELIRLIEFVNQRNVNDIHRSMLIYTYWPYLDTAFGLSRNSGFASEPATFCVFIILGIAIREALNGGRPTKRTFVYILAIVSSFSTTGYSALAAYLLTYLVRTKDLFLRFLILIALMLSLYFVYTSIDFLENKISHQYEEGLSADLNSATNGRVLGIRKSLYVIFKYPFFGRGLQAITRPDDPSDPEYADYGFISVVSKFGFVLGVFFLLLFLSGLKYFFDSFNVPLILYVGYIAAILVTLTAQQGIYDIYFMIFFIIGWLKFNKH